jgi:outer membrane receptor protein involved in Fe transport
VQAVIVTRFFRTANLLLNQWQVDSRGDINFTDKDRVFGRYSMFRAHLNDPGIFGVADGPNGLGFDMNSPFVLQHGAVNWTHTFSSSLLTEARAGFNRFRQDGYQIDAQSETDNEVGIPNINTGDPVNGGLAGITVAGPVGGWNMGMVSGTGIPRFEYTTNIEAVNNWSWMRGSHQLRFGGQVLRERYNFLSLNASSRGNFNFAQTITGIAGNSASGLGMATFLLGMPSEFDRAILEGVPEERQTRAGLYVQDIWRVTPKLTASLGLRWDYLSPVTSPRKGGLARFDPDTGDILLGGLGNISSSTGVYTPKDDFAPRLGLAYRLTGNTVLRAGFGRTFFSSGYDATFYHLTSFYPIAAQQTINQSTLYSGCLPNRPRVASEYYSGISLQRHAPRAQRHIAEDASR